MDEMIVIAETTINDEHNDDDYDDEAKQTQLCVLYNWWGWAPRALMIFIVDDTNDHHQWQV